MAKPLRIFIGSSKEQQRLVEWITAFMAREYAGRLEAIPWYIPWPGGRYTLENLLTIVRDTDASILFWTADDKVWYRGTEADQPRDNLAFEAGLFIATHGTDRTQLMVPDYGPDDARKKVKIPSDVAGLTYNSYAWRDGAPESTGLPNKARTVCDGLALLVPRTVTSSQLRELSGRDGVEELRTYVGEWRIVHINAIARLAEAREARMIDVLAAYRVGEIARVLDGFRRSAETQLRACFGNMWDAALVAVYQRKYHDRSSNYIRDAVMDSVSRLLGPCEFDEPSAGHCLRAKNLKDPPRAEYQIRLTSQRITYGFYRIDNYAIIVPLDMKKSQNPAPFAWVLPRESAPKAFDHYVQEFDRMFSEADSVFP